MQRRIEVLFSKNNIHQIFDYMENFHDSYLVEFKSIGNICAFEVQTQFWNLPILKKNSNDISFLFSVSFLKSPTSWGSSSDIVNSAIYDLSLSDHIFNIETGDGGRRGIIVENESIVRIAVPSDVEEALVAELFHS